MEEDEDDIYAPEGSGAQPMEETDDPAAESEAMDEDEEDEDSVQAPWTAPTQQHSWLMRVRI